jgi:hypothetical protein
VRAISPYSKYKFIAIHEVTEILADGTRRPIKEGWVCHFRTGDLTDWERDAARTRFHMRGGTIEQDMVTPVDLTMRVSSYDTKDVPEHLREEVEKRLLATANANDHLVVEAPETPKPWPNYDVLVIGSRFKTEKDVVTAITARVTDLGLDPDDVAFYERATLDRDYVLEALTAARPEGEEVLEVSA